MPHPKKKLRRELTPRQKKLVALLPDVQSGKKTKKAALLEAGYSEKTALQQARPFGSVRNNVAMQEALRKAGVTEARLAEKIAEGLDATRTYSANFQIHTASDFHAQHAFVKTGAELLDAFPTKKLDVQDVTPLTYRDIEPKKARTVAEARALAEETAVTDEAD